MHGGRGSGEGRNLLDEEPLHPKRWRAAATRTVRGFPDWATVTRLADAAGRRASAGLPIDPWFEELAQDRED